MPQSANDSWCYVEVLCHDGSIKYIKVNPETFQFILFGRDNNSTLTVHPGATLESLKVVKFNGNIITIAFQLNFDEHVSEHEASMQINVLSMP